MNPNVLGLRIPTPSLALSQECAQTLYPAASFWVMIASGGLRKGPSLRKIPISEAGSLQGPCWGIQGLGQLATFCSLFQLSPEV
jgi:hypothetical protein